MLWKQLLSAAALMVLMVSSTNAAPNAALVRTHLPGDSEELAKAASVIVTEAGYKLMVIDSASLCDAGVVSRKNFDLLVLPNAADLPMASISAIQAFLKSGGSIMAMNAPMWQRRYIQLDGEWTTQDALSSKYAGILPEHVVCRQTKEEVGQWNRSSSHLQIKTSFESTADGPWPGQSAMHVVIPEMLNWDTVISPALSKPFALGDKLTVFTAKGAKGTAHLSLEWTEKDGSRWFAAVPLNTEWRRYVLRPEDFHFWQSNPNRGGQGDHFRPENAEVVTVGLAYTHTGQASGKQEYWVGPIGTARTVEGFDETASAQATPVLENLAPGYKFYNTSSQNLQTVLGANIKLSRKLSVQSTHPRASGNGFDKSRSWRWMPVINMLDEHNEWSGCAASMLIHTADGYSGGAWLTCGTDDVDFYKLPAVRQALTHAVKQMRDGVYLLDGGSNFYTYFDDQSVKLGARIANLGSRNAAEVTLKVNVSDTKTGKRVYVHEWKANIAAGGQLKKLSEWLPKVWPATGYTVRTELLQHGQVIDQLSNSIYVWRPSAKKQFVTTKEGQFILNGKRWRANGVNYMPSSGVATEDGAYFEYWLGAKSYDPIVVERDLNRIQRMGMNAVSVFCYAQSAKDQNLLDLLRRIQLHGMKANLSLRPGTPIDFQWKDISSIIRYYRLWENDAVFAYDLAWEPSFGSREERVIFDREWEEWVIERYGSIKNAEQDWQYPIPRRADGSITNPAPFEVDVDPGAWRRMTAAYRRFLDTVLYKRYSSARRLVRSMDPNHLVSFRMSDAANPTYSWEGRITYDFPYLAAAVDFLAPEAYGRIGNWQNVKPGWFQYEYARWAAADKPMMWAEGGVSVWDAAQMAASADQMKFQAELYTHLYRMITSSGCSGIMYWWYPGGYRYGENSDYGIINPDGSDRGSTKVIKELGRKYLAAQSRKATDVWITIDRDKHPDGVKGIYDEVGPAFWQAIEAGKSVGLRTAGTSTNTATCPLIAVGNTPYNGSNPLKYVDAAIDTVQILAADGKWTEVKKGGRVKVKAGQSVKAKLSITNLGEAKLLSCAQRNQLGQVFITAESADSTMRCPISTSLGKQQSGTYSYVISSPQHAQSAELTLGFEIQSRGRFGERFHITLEQ